MRTGWMFLYGSVPEYGFYDAADELIDKLLGWDDATDAERSALELWLNALPRGVTVPLTDAPLPEWAVERNDTESVLRIGGETYSREVRLFDDAGNREKFTVMDKWEVICDDSRNPDFDGLEEFLQFGRAYRLTFEDVGPSGDCPCNGVGCECETCKGKQ